MSGGGSVATEPSDTTATASVAGSLSPAKPPFQRSQSSRRPSMAVMGKSHSSKSIGVLTRDRSRGSLYSDGSRASPSAGPWPAAVPEAAVLVNDDLENVELGEVDLPFVRPLITVRGAQAARCGC